MHKKQLFTVVLTLAFVGMLLFAWLNQYAISDSIRLALYDPPSNIVKLADDSGMSDAGRNLFYVSTPEVLQEAQFDAICNFAELGLVLGCYDGREIYILDVIEADLESVESVTAAHEMLHVAYSRLSAGEKNDLIELLEVQIKSVKNERIAQEIEAYRNDPLADINNELHSILGSEYGDLIPELEAYYSQYFDDRSLVIAKSAEYEKVFNEIEASIASFDTQLADIKTTVDRLELEVEGLGSQIIAERSTLESYRQSGQIQQYNAAVPGFNALVESHNAKIVQIKDLINEYNRLVAERNENVIRQNDLIKSLDSDLEAI